MLAGAHRFKATRFVTSLALFFTCAVALGLLGAPRTAWAQAAPQAPAGTNITNQAVATYTDGSGIQRSTTSNAVTTVVQQVAAVNVEAPGAQTAVAGSPVSFPHTITNNGNGTDTFTLAATDLAGDSFNITPVIYADANGDGVADNNTPITQTPALAAGAVFSVIVSGTVPAGATINQTGIVRLTATSQFDPAVSDANDDTVTVTTNADINVSKAFSNTSGAPGSGPYTVTATFVNNGNTTATNLVLRDVLDPAFVYVPGSGRSSVTGGTPLSDAVGGDPAGIDYSFTPATREVRAAIASVPAGGAGTVSFQVTIAPGTTPQTAANRILFDYFNGAQPSGGNTSNTATFTVNQVAALTYTGVTIASAPQGTIVSFPNPLTNTGNGTDTFNISIGPNTFPAGTVFTLFQPDGVTPLTDTNGDGTVDTGPIAAGAVYNVVVRATLPAAAFGGGPFTVNTTATSVFNPAVSATAIDQLNTITPSTVDITGGGAGAGAPGAGPGPETTPVLVRVGNPGTTVTFPVSVTNTSATPDSYALQFSGIPGFAPATPLPAGFTLVFRDAGGAIVTNTGALAAGATFNGTVDVLIPAGATPQDVELYLRAVSPTTAAEDTIHHRVTVGAVRSLSFEPNNTGQIFQGGSTLYTHTLINTGNVLENSGTLATTDSAPGFTSTLIYDANGNGVLDATDPVVDSFDDIVGTGGPGLSPGEAATLFVRVFAPAGVAPNTANNTVATATATGGAPTETAIDTTTVVSGELRVVKEQALDLNNDGEPDGPYTTATLTTGARPGVTIRYRITVTNTGTAPALGVVVSDATPAFTVYDTGDGAIGADGVPDSAVYFDGTTYQPATITPANGAAGTITFSTVGTIAPGQSVVFYLGVRIR